MTPFEIGVAGIGALFLLLFLGMPVGIGMMLVGAVGMISVCGMDAGLGLLRIVPYTTVSDYNLCVVPLFILMGEFAFHAEISRDLYSTMRKWLGSLRGGLAMTTIGACAGFAAVSGSSLATAGAMGEVALPEMKRYNYDDRLATGCIAAGGSIGIMIPPSVALILYGLLTEQSIGKLFLAGFIPGLLEAIVYIGIIYALTTINPLMGPPGPVTGLREKISSLSSIFPVVLLFFLVIGGIYAGIFSPNEAGAVGAFGVLVYGIAKSRLNWQGIKKSLLGAGRITAMAFLILIGAMIFGYFLTVTRVPFVLADVVSELPVNRYIILSAILFIYLCLGCIMEVMGMLILIVPIFFPVVMALGFDPIWFGILTVRAVEMGQITPPVGINVFVIKGVAKDIPLETIFRGIIPFFLGDIIILIILVVVPQLSLYLPGLIK